MLIIQAFFNQIFIQFVRKRQEEQNRKNKEDEDRRLYDEEHGDQLKRVEELVLKEFEDSLLQVTVIVEYFYPGTSEYSRSRVLSTSDRVQRFKIQVLVTEYSVLESKYKYCFMRVHFDHCFNAQIHEYSLLWM